MVENSQRGRFGVKPGSPLFSLLILQRFQYVGRVISGTPSPYPMCVSVTAGRERLHDLPSHAPIATSHMHRMIIAPSNDSISARFVLGLPPKHLVVAVRIRRLVDPEISG